MKRDKALDKLHPDIEATMAKIGDRTTANYISLFPEELIVSLLDAFIINKPMTNGVGGDGFWVHQTADSLYVAVFDCMGHGHLASIMTRVYTRSLKKIVADMGEEDPGQILNLLHLEIKGKFESKSEMLVGTGADVGVVKISMMERKLIYAGAKMELMKVTDGKFETLKPGRKQIGDLFEYEHVYTSTDIDLKDGEVSKFYLSSDGFKDLIGGTSGRKLGKARIETLLEDHYKEPMVLQKHSISNFMDEWAQYYKPLDDILIVGFSL